MASLTAAGSADVKVGDMPVLKELTESTGGFEALKLSKTLNSQNIRRLKLLLLALKGFIGLVEILLVSNSKPRTFGESRK